MIFGFYSEIKEKGLEQLVAEADARFKVSPPQCIGRVRLKGEQGEQLVLPVDKIKKKMMVNTYGKGKCCLNK